MTRLISLTEKESILRNLLLEVSSFISETKSCPKPELRFTGGWVRDKLLGSPSDDIDLSISSMTGKDFVTSLEQALDSHAMKSAYGPDILGHVAHIAANPEKSKHLETVTTKILGLNIDMVNLRKETYSEHSRTPAMENGTAEEDAFRRDSTVNALFYNLQTGDVEDLTGRGLDDLDAKLIKTPLDPYQTFKDDPLRILRSIRFASKLGFRIDSKDEEAMSSRANQDALRLKISRERVGVEIEKMMRGPDPCAAVQLIDRLDLYGTIFMDPKAAVHECPKTETWRFVCGSLNELVKTGLKGNERSTDLHNIAAVLLRDSEDLYLAWMMSCFVPWADTKLPAPNSKTPTTAAAIAAREGIKAKNTLSKIINNAGLEMKYVIRMKDSAASQLKSLTSPLKRKDCSSTRELQGQAIRHWGPHWRSIAIHALLVQLGEFRNESDRQMLFRDYALWLLELRRLELLDVYQLKPIVTGDEISAALGTKSGPWLKRALQICIEWQLRNPDETNKEGCIEEIIGRRNELELG